MDIRARPPALGRGTGALASDGSTLAPRTFRNYVHTLFEDQVLSRADRIAVCCAQRRLTYRELNRRANRLARHLLSMGAGAEQCIGLLTGRSVETAIGVLAILKTGGAFLPLSPDVPQTRLQRQVEDSRVQLIVTIPALNHHSEGIPAKTIVLDAKDCTALDDLNPEVRLDPDNLAYTICTSGSTGTPKTVAVTHANLVVHVTAAAARIEAGCVLGEQLRMAAPGAMTADLVYTVFFCALCGGHRLFIPSEEEATDMAAFTRLVSEHQIDVMKLAPFHLRHLTNNLSATGIKWKTLILGGERFSFDLLKSVRAAGCSERIFNSYGPTEAAIACMMFEVPNESYVMSAAESVPLGRPFPHARAYVAGVDLDVALNSAYGELYIAGEGVARCYSNAPAETAERFLPDPLSIEPGRRMYRTGDIVRRLPSGDLEFVQRADDQVKVLGFRVDPHEVEQTLERHPIVAAAAVLTEGASEAVRLSAYVQLRNHAARQGNEVGRLRQFLLSEVPSYMVPATVRIVEALPLRPNGKIDRTALTALTGLSDAAESPQVIPARDHVEYRLLLLWRELLGREVGVTDDFFAIGGESITAIVLLNRVHAEFGVRLPPPVLFAAPTIESLACRLRRHSVVPSTPTLSPIWARGSRVPLFCVHPIGGDVLCYAELARALGPDQPVYGLRAPGLDGECTPLTRIDDMASEYIREISQIHPKGPYLLAGWSFGGRVAFEMAHQLRCREREVGLIAVFDTPLTCERQSNYEDETVLFGEICETLSIPVKVEELRSMPPESRLDHCIQIGRRHGRLHPDFTRVQAVAHLAVIQGCLEAADHWTPQPCPGPVVLFKCSEQPAEASWDDHLNWRSFVTGSLIVHTVPGDHQFMMAGANVKALAAQLTAHLAVEAKNTANSRLPAG